jgi:hypothetical protein
MGDLLLPFAGFRLLIVERCSPIVDFSRLPIQGRQSQITRRKSQMRGSVLNWHEYL